jgi:hypothetical protein
VTWFYDTSIWITMPVFVGGFVLVSCLIVWLLRPVVRRLVDDSEQWDQVVGHVIGAFGMFFGILLALVAVSVYENFAMTRTAVLDEAAKLGALYRGAEGLPDEVGDPIRATIEAYTNEVVLVDFPSQRAGEIPVDSTPFVDTIEKQLQAFEPISPNEQALYLQLLSTYDDFIEIRQERVDDTTLELPPLFWLVIWVGAAINAVLIGFISVKSLRLHLILAGLLALFVGLVIFVTADLDHPYAGSISVGPGAFERVLEVFDD